VWTSADSISTTTRANSSQFEQLSNRSGVLKTVTDFIRFDPDDASAGSAFAYHKDPFPLDWRHDGMTIMIAFFSLLLAAGGGIGGGGILVPVYMLVLGFHPKHAVALSNFTILGGSIANTLLNSRRRHPNFSDRPLIDWDLIIIMEPTTIFGAVFGALMSKVLPNVILTSLLVVILAFMAHRTLKKGLEMWHKESLQQLEARANGSTVAAFEMESVPCTEASTEPVELVPQSGVDEVEASYHEMDANGAGAVGLINDARSVAAKSDANWKIMLLTLCFGGTCLLTILKGGGHLGSPLGLECGSQGYWLVYFGSVPWVLAFAVYFRYILVGEFRRKVAFGHAFGRGEIQWNDKNTIRYPAICTLSGIFAGLFGIGGGIVKGPLMLEMGVIPAVASASAAAMILYTSSAATTSFAVFGLLHFSYGVVFFTLGFVSTAIGQVTLTKFLKKHKRESPIVLSIGFVIGASSILVAINTVARSYGRSFGDLLRPHGVCTMEVG
jgi:uncharacterized membrane protein YfcA